MALVNKRIIDLPLRTNLRSDDYVAVDSSDGGTAKYNIAELETAVNDVAPVIINASDTASVIAWADGADDMPMKSVVLKLVPHQEGSGDPSPENVRTISGYTAVNVTRAGKNLLPATVDGIKQSATIASWNGNVGTQSGITFTLMQDEKGNLESIVLNGTATSQIQFFLNRGAFYKGDCLINGGVSNSIRVAVYGVGGSTGGDYAFSRDGKQALSSWIYVANGTVCNNVVIKPMIRPASIVDGTYEPFVESTTYPITIPSSAGTVYGGELDVVNGVLKVTKEIYTLTGSETWTAWGQAYYSTTLPIYGINNINTVNADGSKLKGVTVASLYNGSSASGLGVRNNNVYISKTDHDNITSLTGMQVVYDRLNPTEITLDPVTVKTLLGSNTIWMDADGTIQCDYPADTKLYIDALTAPDDDMIANSNIASGKYFTVNNRLYLSTSAIAQGEAIVVGTNCTQTDLATALNALNA